MYITFIAHAGFAIEEAGTTLLIDPWFTESSLTAPLVESLGGQKTIDFHIPPLQNAAKERARYQPDVILLSHFHPHHAPVADLSSLIQNAGRSVMVGFPGGPDTGETGVRAIERLESFGDVNPWPIEDGGQRVIGPFTVTAFTHAVAGHIAWQVQSKTGSMLHIADGALHRSDGRDDASSVWRKFFDLRPDLLCLSAGRNSLRMNLGTGRDIYENACLSPIQAAKLTRKIQPRIAGLIGNQNHSIWRQHTEFIPDYASVEEEFRWALEWLCPDTKHLILRPGHTISIGTPPQSGTIIDTMLP